MFRQILFISFALISTAVRGDIFVIVNPDNPVNSLSVQQVSDFYLGRNHSFPTGEFALVLEQRHDSPLRELFFLKVARMSLGQVNTYWSRLMFSGQETPPQMLPNEQVVIDTVRRNRGAIGYVKAIPPGSNLRVVLHITE